ncbi:MAG: radical SAM protein [Bacteroidales bacterium]|nr:radical SAM protein [Bacteroidales bacterium]
MEKIKHYTIPVFVPELACPFQCAFCNQEKISGHQNIPTEKEITDSFDAYLRSFRETNRHVEVGFFGGTFTGIPLAEQENYLRLVQPYLDAGTIHGIRLSTRPDYINSAVLSILKQYRVTTIELGAQSLDDEVLKASYRGHTARQVEQASEMIRDAGFDLGLQMMIGLPEDTLEKSLATAQKIIELGASNTRIYPALVIRDTAMHQWFRQGKYKPLSLEEAVEWSRPLLLMFEKARVNVIRMGLHPSESLLDHTDLVAGPFHPSFRELVLTQIWKELFIPLLRENKGKKVEIQVPAAELNAAIGHHSENKKILLRHFHEVKFVPVEKLKNRNFRLTILPDQE